MSDHANEYPDSMVAMLELIWGDGFMSPGGEGHVWAMVEDLELAGRRVLDIGCGLGGPACLLAGERGARVVGTDLEAPLIARAEARAVALGVEGRTEFHQVRAGSLGFGDASFDFGDASFDVVMSSGGVTQTADKPAMFRECLRVLEPGGWLSLYDWMKPEGEYSDDMRYWFETEGLTYAMETPEHQASLLRAAGFETVTVSDRSQAYRPQVRAEYERLRGEDFGRLVELLGRDRADRAVENWRATVVVCEKGEMLQVYTRARRPGAGAATATRKRR